MVFMVFSVVRLLVVAQQTVLGVAEWTGRKISDNFSGLWVQSDCGLFHISVHQPGRERQAISLTREHWQKPVFLLVPKDLNNVLPETKRETVFIRACPEDRCSKCLDGRSVLSHKPQVVAEEGQNTNAEHGRHKKEKQDVEFGLSVPQLVCPKFYEIL